MHRELHHAERDAYIDGWPTARSKSIAELTMSEGQSIDTEFVTIAKVGAIPEGEGRSFQVGDRLVAVFLSQGEYRAIDDLCPHMGASLGAGYLDEEGIVTCPWHAWRFCTRDGKWADNPRLAVDTFEVRVLGDEIQVRMQN
jgi:nitrite reductase (NADH) small subunit/3-phenylpropionate/trans-cinnamate dioxygenase ferredoxin subunit